MAVALRAFRPEDLQLMAEWATAYGLDTYVSRSRPRNALAICHDPRDGLYWFIIVCSGVDVGTIWLEPGDRPNESILGIFLKHSSVFGRGIGSRAIRLAVGECRKQHPMQVITLGVRQSNARAVACYKKVGFLITSSGTKVLPSGEHLPYFRMQLTPSGVPPSSSSESLGFTQEGTA